MLNRVQSRSTNIFKRSSGLIVPSLSDDPLLHPRSDPHRFRIPAHSDPLNITMRHCVSCRFEEHVSCKEFNGEMDMQLHMVVEGQRKTALILSLFWAMAMATAYLFHEMYGLNLYWYTVVSSLLLLIIGLSLSYGRGEFILFLTFFPIIMTKECLYRYNVEKVSLVIGTFMVAMSCAFLFISMDSVVAWVILSIAIAYVFACIYVLISKRFRAYTQPEY